MFDIGYGFRKRWAGELAVHFDNASPDYDDGAAEHGGEVTSLEWENILVLTQRGKSWLDAGLYAALVYDTEAHDFVLESGPLLQKRFGREQLNLNFMFERPLASNASTELLYRAQWKRNAPDSIDYGLQAFGDFGHFGALGQEDECRVGSARPCSVASGMAGTQAGSGMAPCLQA